MIPPYPALWYLISCGCSWLLSFVPDSWLDLFKETGLPGCDSKEICRVDGHLPTGLLLVSCRHCFIPNALERFLTASGEENWSFICGPHHTGVPDSITGLHHAPCIHHAQLRGSPSVWFRATEPGSAVLRQARTQGCLQGF